MPRIAPVTGKSDVPAEHHNVVDEVLKVFGNIRGPFSIMLHSPKLAERVLPLVTFFREDSVVEAEAALARDPRRGARARGGLCVGGASRRRPPRRGAEERRSTDCAPRATRPRCPRTSATSSPTSAS